MYYPCPNCGHEQTAPIRAVVAASVAEPRSDHELCLMEHLHIRPLHDRLGMPRPTIIDAYLPCASIFEEVDDALRQKLRDSAPDWAEDDFQEMLATWEVKRLFWERLWHCSDCDCVFEPVTRQFAKSAEMSKLLSL